MAGLSRQRDGTRTDPRLSGDRAAFPASPRCYRGAAPDRLDGSASRELHGWRHPTRASCSRPPRLSDCLAGVGLSLGSADGIDVAHLDRLAALAEQIEPGLLSEHVAWSTSGGVYLADLLPLPLTEEALAIVCENIAIAQATLRRQILVENPSTYLRYHHSTIPEWEFMSALAGSTGCGILCDVNNIAVSAANHGFDTGHYLASLPADRIGEIHVAGHSVRELGDGRSIRIDDHASPVSAEVWRLLEYALARFGPVPVLVEWDNDIPPLADLLREADQAERRLDAARERERRYARPA